MAFLRALRLRLVLFAAVAAALLWWGTGFGLRDSKTSETTQGAAGTPEPHDVAPPRDASPPREATPRDAHPADAATGEAPRPEDGAQAGARPDANPNPGPTEPVRAPAPAAAPAARATDGDDAADADRRGAVDERIRQALQGGRLAEAEEAIASAGGGLARTEAAQVAVLRWIDELHRELKSGSFHAVQQRLRRAEVGRSRMAQEALQGLTKAAGLPELLVPPTPARERTAVEPAPAPRLAGRLVRLSADDRAPARVLEVAGREASLRVLGPGGVTFPKRALFELEPDAVTADEAAELGLAAYGAGDDQAARVWAAIACARSAARSARLAQLLALLPGE